MRNISAFNTNFVLVGLVEIGTFRHLYASFALLLYVFTIFVCSMIVHITWTIESLHEPMYIFICNLILNVMLGSSAYFPKLAIDLLSGNITISLSACLFQAFCIQSYALVEMFTFTAMAYDRYLAVGHPLRYHSLVTNQATQKVLLVIWTFGVVGVIVVTSMTARLHFCGLDIYNVYCETMSLLPLACDGVNVINVYGIIWSLAMVTSSMLIIIYSYIRTVLICLRLSVEVSQKAMHTLVTHIVTFSFFMTALMFTTYRYRINNGSLPTFAHVAIPMVGMSVAVSVNPLIYGMRTKALKTGIVRNLQNIMGKSKQ